MGWSAGSVPGVRGIMCIHDDLPRNILRPERHHQTSPPLVSSPQPLPQLPGQLRDHRLIGSGGISTGYCPQSDDDVIRREH